MTTPATQVSPKHSRVGLWVGLAAIAACVAIVGYISANRPAEQSLAAIENQKQVELGQLTYQQNCMGCHGVKLKGKPSWEVASPNQAGIPLSADGTTWHMSDNHLFDAIATGERVKAGKTTRVHEQAYAKSAGGRLTDNEIWALIAYFKTTWTVRQIESQKETSLRERPENATGQPAAK
jgi:mono/diheme cytochrome c family protein